MKVNPRDLGSALLFVLMGLVYGGVSWSTLAMGSARNMGPGMFPLILSGVLILLGAAIALRSILSMDTEKAIGRIAWRPVILLSAATALFATFLEQLGLLPVVIATALVASKASSQVRLSTALIVSSGIAVLCILVFIYGINLPIPILGPWILSWRM